MSEPERRDASTTTTPDEIPAMMRFRMGKFWGRGSAPGGYSETRRWSTARAVQPRVLPRIVDVEAAPEDRDRAARPLERRRVGGRVDAAGEPRDDRHADSREVPGEARRHVAPVAGRLARSDDRDRGQAEALDPSERMEHERRIRDFAEQARVFVVERRQETDPGALGRGRPARRLGVVGTAQNGPRQILGSKFRGQFVLRRGQERLDPAPRAQHRPETLGRERPAPGPGEGGATRQTGAHRFNVLLMEKRP